MRFLSAILFAAACFVAWQLGLIQAVLGMGEASLKEPSTIEERIASGLVTARQALGVLPLVSDGELQQWLLNAGKSGALDPAEIPQKVRRAWPQYQDVRVFHTYSLFESSVVERIAAWPEAGAGELTHLCVAVEPGFCGIGTSATVVAGERLPLFTPEALDDPKQGQFYSVCPLCGQGQPCEIPRQARMFTLRCQHCEKVYAMLAVDSEGRFRHVNEYLTGYMPPNAIPPGPTKIQELMAIWRAEAQLCRYFTDGAKDNDDAWQTAEETLSLRRGDCEDSAILLADWLLSRGYEARVAIGSYDATRSTHAWVVVRLEGNDFVLESTEFPLTRQQPPLVRESGSRYAPELLFDRLAIYSPKKSGDELRLDYWGKDTWVRVEPTRPKDLHSAQAHR